MSRACFIGSWQLRSWTITTDGHATCPFGEDARGLLIYSDDGYMSVVLNKPDAGPAPAGSLRNLPTAQKARLFDHCFAYAGRWRLAGGQVIHHVHHSHNPNFIGSRQARSFAFEADRLTLCAEEALAGRRNRLHRLVWQRATA